MEKELNERLTRACNLLQETFKNAEVEEVQSMINSIIYNCSEVKKREYRELFTDTIKDNKKIIP